MNNMSVETSSLFNSHTIACADPEGGQGVRSPSLKNHKNIGFLCNTGPDPLNNHKATNVGPSSACQRNVMARL